MPKFGDWSSIQEVKDIMERYLSHFPMMFGGFDLDKMHFIMTKKKKSKEPIKVHAVGYPRYVWMNPYVVEVYETWWKDMDTTRKNIAVFKAMCSIPEDGFDEAAKMFGKVLPPEIKMYMREYAACGGIPNWMDNPSAKDPMVRTDMEIAEDVPSTSPMTGVKMERTPVTPEDLN